MALIAFIVFSWFCQADPLPPGWEWELGREFRSMIHSWYSRNDMLRSISSTLRQPSRKATRNLLLRPGSASFFPVHAAIPR